MVESWVVGRMELWSAEFYIVTAVFAFIAGVTYALLNPKKDDK